MKAVVQRVSQSSVSVEGRCVGSIEYGLNILLGISQDDTESEIPFLADKIMNLRIFEDENGKMNRSCVDAGGSYLIISQFTLYGDCRRGRRPSFDLAMKGNLAQELYEKFVEYVRKTGAKVQTGIFGADMQVDIVNEGPVTLIVESKNEMK